jgi:hypothetical protein
MFESTSIDHQLNCRSRGPLSRSRALVLLAGLALVPGSVEPALATHPCTSPLVLDLGNDGVNTTSLNYSVDFDINGDGVADTIAWTAWYFDEAFLWIDLNHNRRVDDGSELFGNSMLLPSGEYAPNGFDALAAYDDEALGGNEDGAITPQDLVWPELLLWVDSNHNGLSEPTEIRSLRREGVVEIGLSYTESDYVDGNQNLHKFQGKFLKYVRGGARPFLREQDVDDVFFVAREPQQCPAARCAFIQRPSVVYGTRSWRG